MARPPTAASRASIAVTSAFMAPCPARAGEKIRVIVYRCLGGASRSVRSVPSIIGLYGSSAVGSGGSFSPGLRPDRVHGLLDRPHGTLSLRSLARLHASAVITPGRRVQLGLRHLRRDQNLSPGASRHRPGKYPTHRRRPVPLPKRRHDTASLPPKPPRHAPAETEIRNPGNSGSRPDGPARIAEGAPSAARPHGRRTVTCAEVGDFAEPE